MKPVTAGKGGYSGKAASAVNGPGAETGLTIQPSALTGAPIWSRNGFGRAMTDRGYKSAKSGSNYWVNLELTRRASDFRAEEASSDDRKRPTDADDDEPIEF